MKGKDADQWNNEAGIEPSQIPYELQSSLGRLGGSHELFRSLVEFFLEDCPGLLQQLQSGIEKGDAKQVERAGHSIKGLAANFSALPTVNAANMIEEFGRLGDLVAARRSLPELETELKRLQLALADYLRASNT